MRIKSLSAKISLMVACIILITVAAIVLVALTSMNRLTSDIVRRNAEASNMGVVKLLDEYRKEAFEKAYIIAGTESLHDALDTGDTVLIRSVLSEYSAGLDFATLVDAKGVTLVSTITAEEGTNLNNKAIFSTTMSTGRGTSIIERGSAVPLGIFASAALKDKSGAVEAVLICGFDLSDPEHVDTIKSTVGSEVTLFLGDTRLNSTLINEQGNRVVGTAASAGISNTVLNQKQDYTGRVTLFGKQYQVYYSPWVEGGETLGMIFSGLNIDETLNEQQMILWIIMAVAVFALLASIVVVIFMSNRMIAKPLSQFTAFLKKAGATGDISMSPDEMAAIDKYSALQDEIGQCISGMKAFVGHISNIADELESVAKKDLTVELDILSKKDVLGNSIQLTVDSLNSMFYDIGAATIQVSNGAKQIADGAQTLAEGSTEQAATVQELSASSSEVDYKTKVNSEMAVRAASLANTIKRNAEKGSRQMDEMITAVNEINQASQSISKVIKAIDDIAFQTNILALNAAVEAARAGQHGKGFAVVADEVRNLAAKSAAAANDTGELISNSMAKAEQGARIAEETAASLSEIVSGINESSEIISEIASSSEAQTAGISQVSAAIDQVAQVVQQNSATAEESAAASEELSGQADLLEQLISQFKLKDRGAIKRGNPPASAQVTNQYAASGVTSFALSGNTDKY